jgi:hypothetical protein
MLCANSCACHDFFVHSGFRALTAKSLNAEDTENTEKMIPVAETYAAFVAACAAAGSSQRTDTSFETPGSCIVTP